MLQQMVRLLIVDLFYMSIIQFIYFVKVDKQLLCLFNINLRRNKEHLNLFVINKLLNIFILQEKL